MVIGDVNRRGGVFEVMNTINIIIFVVYNHNIHLNIFKHKVFPYFLLLCQVQILYEDVGTGHYPIWVWKRKCSGN